MSLVTIEGLDHYWGPKPLFKDVNLTLDAGEMVALVGPNGAGKTTLLRLILGLIRPYKGKILLMDMDPSHKTQARHLVGYMPQRPRFNPWLPLTVEDVVLSGWPGEGWFGGWHWPRAAQANLLDTLAMVGIDHLRKQPISQLSGGQQQLALLARALNHRPRLLLLDEPTSSLDLSAQRHFFDLLDFLGQQLELTVLMVSHNLPEVNRWADRLLILDQGQLHATVACEQNGRSSQAAVLGASPIGKEVLGC